MARSLLQLNVVRSPWPVVAQPIKISRPVRTVRQVKWIFLFGFVLISCMIVTTHQSFSFTQAYTVFNFWLKSQKSGRRQNPGNEVSKAGTIVTSVSRTPLITVPKYRRVILHKHSNLLLFAVNNVWTHKRLAPWGAKRILCCSTGISTLKKLIIF